MPERSFSSMTRNPVLRLIAISAVLALILFCGWLFFALKGFHWYESPEWVLVIVGIVTCFVIGWQSYATSCAARATQVSAEVLWAGQQAQIAAAAHGNPTKDLLSDTSRVQLELTNKGMTTAYDCIYESWIELLPSPSGDFTSNAEYFKNAEKIALYPNHIPLTINVPLMRALTEAECSGLKSLRLYACIRVRVEYRDARALERYANFGFYVMAEGLGFLPKYNDAN
jgi:hypothetical protein